MANDIFAYLNGRRCTLDGIAGTFRHEITQAIYPYPHTVEQLIHYPTRAGQTTDAYKAIQRTLRDHWVTDLTGDIERYCAIATRHGYRCD